MTLNTPPTNQLEDLVTRLLDRGYDAATGQVLRSIAADARGGVIAQRLAELETEAERLAEQGERLRPDNPVLRALLADLEPVLERQAARVDAAGADVQAAGTDAAGRITRELALPGVDDQVLARLGVGWNRPDPEAVAALVDFVNSPAWAGEIGAYSDDVLGVVRNQAVRGVVQGWGPIRTARQIRRSVEGFPAHRANNLMRTLQLQSYRRGSAIHQRANADILDEQIRVAVLDTRVCLACVALHGERLPVGEVVVDHHQGRCTSIPVVTGRPRTVQSGEDWYRGLPEDERLALAGPGAFEALERGDARLRDFVQRYDDEVFGEMVRQGAIERALSGGNRSRGRRGLEPSGDEVLTGEGWQDDDDPGFADISTRDDLDEYALGGGLRASYMWDSGALGFGADGRIAVDEGALYDHIKTYVRETRSVYESRNALQAIMQGYLRDQYDINVTTDEADRIINGDEARRAQALLKLADVAGLRLTEPQRRRLERAETGDYLDMAFQEVGERGTFLNSVDRARERSSGIRKDSAEYRRLKDDWDRQMGRGRYR